MIQSDHLPSGQADALSRTLVKQIFALGAAADQIQPLDIVVRSLTSPKAARVVQEFILQDFAGPLTEKLDQPMQLRTALIAAFLAGVGIFRNVLGVEPLLEPEGGEAARLIVNTMPDMMRAGPTIGRAEATKQQKGLSHGYSNA